MLAVVKSETVVENFTELLLIHLLEAGTGSQGQELHELSEFLIECRKSAALPDLLDLLKWQITVTILVVKI